jgi:Glyoxalase/Bleomycin resistance protein/Dioxygenase superfamily.
MRQVARAKHVKKEAVVNERNPHSDSTFQAIRPIDYGSASLQLALKVSAADVYQCADELVRQGVHLLSPPTDQVFGHRTLFFRDPDGNLPEVFADN